MEGKNIVLVTWDFTEKSEVAYAHAEVAAKVLGSKIVLLHIAKKDSEIKSLEERLHGVIADKYANKTNKPTALVEVGTIFTTISDVANDKGAKMVFMGTHGIKGSQKFFGSWALKVIANTKVPFIVVQELPRPNQYKNIVFPLNYKRENKESTNWITYFSKYFNSKFNIFNAHHTDPNLKKGIESNIIFITRVMKTKGVKYDMDTAPGVEDLLKESMDYTQQKEADSVMVMITKDIGFSDYMMGAHEQHIIANKLGIPVICINPRPPKIGGSFSTSGS